MLSGCLHVRNTITHSNWTGGIRLRVGTVGSLTNFAVPLRVYGSSERGLINAHLHTNTSQGRVELTLFRSTSKRPVVHSTY